MRVHFRRLCHIDLLSTLQDPVSAAVIWIICIGDGFGKVQTGKLQAESAACQSGLCVRLPDWLRGSDNMSACES